jgi:hypothetical protein
MMLDALAPQDLAVPDTVITLMVPGATGVTPPVELFGSQTRPAFDELGAARTLAQMIVDAILQRDRAGGSLNKPRAPAPSSLSPRRSTASSRRRGDAPRRRAASSRRFSA